MATEWERHRRAGRALSGSSQRGDPLPPHSSQGWEIGQPTTQVDGSHFPLERGMVKMELVTKPETTKLIWSADLPSMLMPGHGGEYLVYGMGFLLGELPAKFYCGTPDLKKLIAEYTEGSRLDLTFKDGEERQYELKNKRDQLFFAMDFGTPGQEDLVDRLTMRGRNIGGNPSAYTFDVRYPEQPIDPATTSLTVVNSPLSYLNWNQNLVGWVISHHYYRGQVENPALSAQGLSPLIQQEVRAVSRKK